MADGSAMNLEREVPVDEPKWPPEAGQQVCTILLTPTGYRVAVMTVAIASSTDVMLTTGKPRRLEDCFPYTVAGIKACGKLRQRREDYRRAHQWPPLPKKK